MTLLKNSQSPDLQLQAGASWDYIWNGKLLCHEVPDMTG